MDLWLGDVYKRQDPAAFVGCNFERIWKYGNAWDSNDNLPVLQSEAAPPAAPEKTDYTIKDCSTPVLVINKNGTAVNNIAAVAAGGNHTILLSSEGHVFSFGENNYGQLGNGINGVDTKTGLSKHTTKAENILSGRSASVDIYLTDVIRIDAGKNYSGAIKSNGKVLTWGGNEHGQLSIGTVTLRNQPILAVDRSGYDLFDIIDISAGGSHALALSFDKELYAWGNNENKQLASSTKT